MHNSESRGGYSAFFSSGYRAIRARGETLANISFTNPFPEHAICQDCKCTPIPRTLRSPPQDTRKRRHSVIRFFDRIASSTSDMRERRRSSFESDIWNRIHVATGLQIPIPRHSRTEKQQQQSIDPFSSSPESKSFFIELTDSPIHIRNPSWFGETKRNSISSYSPRDTSFTPPPMRQRPTSVYTPRTSRPRDHRRWSSMHSAPTYLGKAGGEPELDSSERDVSLPLPEEWIDPAELDWRQFHIELLDDSD